jgi:chemotaxis protein MotB
MSRKRKAPEHENHERWLVSYADFITLLFAFFVVMFASSNADKGKAQQVAESVRKALEEGQVGAVLAGILGTAGPSKAKPEPKKEPDKPGKIVELTPSFVDLTKALKEEVDAGKLKLTLEARGLVVSLREAAFFPSGEAAVNPGAVDIVGKIAAAINTTPNPVRLEGHTDSVPIHNARFQSNWELSAARSIAMLELLAERFAVDRRRLAIAGYADNAPVDANDNEKGRARNRRVDVVILSLVGMQPEPQPPAPEPPKAPVKH